MLSRHTIFVVTLVAFLFFHLATQTSGQERSNGGMSAHSPHAAAFLLEKLGGKRHIRADLSPSLFLVSLFLSRSLFPLFLPPSRLSKLSVYSKYLC